MRTPAAVCFLCHREIGLSPRFDIRHVDKTGCHAAGRWAAGRGVHIQVPTEVLPRVVVDRVKWFAPDQDLGYGVKFSSKIHC